MRRLRQICEKKERLVAGLMSGTSLDGVDVAVLRIKGSGEQSELELINCITIPYDQAVKQEIMTVCGQGAVQVDDICRLNFKLGEIFAVAVNEGCRQAGVSVNELDIIGSHGQTIRHLPGNSTLQIGEPAVIAERTGVITVADFRVRDMAAGGQGAPLVPYSDYILFRHRTKTRLLQNIGGIANVTALKAAAGPEDVVAFDTGPGNMMIDACVNILTGGVQSFDAAGAMAARGAVHEGLLAEMKAHPFLAKPLPKTTGREEFGFDYTAGLVEKYLRQGVGEYDLLATFTAFTAESIALGYRRFIFPRLKVDEIIISGGGSHNKTLVNMLKTLLPGAAFMTGEALGIPGDAKEAVSFALLANEAISGHANNLPGVTGASRSVIMGKILL